MGLIADGWIARWYVMPVLFALPPVGDLLTALLAFAGLLALRCGWRSAIFLVQLFNVAGALDLLAIHL